MLKNNRCSIDANAKQVSCAMSVGNRIVKFQIDTGSTTNIIPVNFAKNVRTTNTTLKTWNNENYKPIGESRQIIKNPKNNKRYSNQLYSVPRPLYAHSWAESQRTNEIN